MLKHLQARHVDWEKHVVDRLDLQAFRKQITISDEEGTRLGIPEDRHGFRAATLNASTDVRHGNPLHLPSIRDGRSDSPRRSRQETIYQVLSYSFPLQTIQLLHLQILTR